MSTRIVDYSATPGSNSTVDSISIAEGMLPSNVNNALRAIMSHLKEITDGTAPIGYSAVADAAAGPTLELHRNSASPADSDLIGNWIFTGEDDGSNKTTYAEIAAKIIDVTDATEDGALLLKAMVAGTLTTIATIDATGLTVVGTVTGTGLSGSNTGDEAAASVTVSGISELATTAETTTGTDTARTITPAGLHGGLAALGDATITASDKIVFADVGSSDALQTDTVQGILDLASTGVVGDALVHAYVSSQINNGWGDNAEYTVIFDTEVADVGADYNTGTGVFTAEATGYHLVTWHLGLVPGSHAGGYTHVNTSNREYYTGYMNTANSVNASGIRSIGGALLIDMDAGDTLTIDQLLAGASKDADMAASSTTWLSIIQLT